MKHVCLSQTGADDTLGKRGQTDVFLFGKTHENTAVLANAHAFPILDLKDSASLLLENGYRLLASAKAVQKNGMLAFWPSAIQTQK